jgi:hypothetical protein
MRWEDFYDLSGRIGDSNRWIVYGGINGRMGYYLPDPYYICAVYTATLSFILQLLYYHYQLASAALPSGSPIQTYLVMSHLFCLNSRIVHTVSLQVRHAS